MDRTGAFRAAARAARAAAGQPETGADVLPPVAPETPFTAEAKDLRRSLGATAAFLRDNAAAYLDADRFLASRRAQMTNAERDAIDAEAVGFVKQAHARLATMRAAVQDSPGTRGAHCRGVVAYLAQRLQAVAAVLERQRAERMARSLRAQQRRAAAATVLPASFDHHSAEGAAAADDDRDEFDDEELSAADMQQLEAENDVLARQLESDLDAARQLETRMAEVSGLLKLFVDEVLDQNAKVESVYDMHVESADRLRRTNEELAKAADASAGGRLYMLGFFIGASVLLLVLDQFY